MADVGTESLYHRLGGYDAIAAATDELLARLQADPHLRDYWKGASTNNQRKARQLIVDFMTEAAGGPAYYTGRDMTTSHVGMHINARLGGVHAPCRGHPRPFRRRVTGEGRCAGLLCEPQDGDRGRLIEVLRCVEPNPRRRPAIHVG